MARHTARISFRRLFNEDGEPFIAFAIGTNSAESMAALAALASGPLEQVGQDAKLVSSLAIQGCTVPIRRADGTVEKLSIGGSANIRRAAAAKPVSVFDLTD